MGLSYSVNLTGTDTGILGLDLVIPTGETRARIVKWEDIPVTLESKTTLSLDVAGSNYAVISSTGESVPPDVTGEIDSEEVVVPSSGCFIATAAYGTPMAGEVETLREFRDEYLLTNPLGQALVNLYYNISPPIAKFITDHPSLKPIVRAGLLPAVAMSAAVVNTTVGEKIATVGLLVLISIAVTIWIIRRQQKDSEYIRE
jgi:hypothetical protein